MIVAHEQNPGFMMMGLGVAETEKKKSAIAST
jgi:hypothetical protein